MASIRISQKINTSGKISIVERFEPPVGSAIGEPLFLALPHGDIDGRSDESAVVQ